MASKPDFLAKVPLFRGFADADLRRFADVTHVETFDRGENMFEIGEPGSSLYIIAKGNVQILQPVRGSEVQLARMGAGDFIGEMAILNDAPRSATARALSDVETLVLDKVSFRELVRARPDVGLKLLEVMSSRIRSADEQIGGLSRQAVRDPDSGLLNRLAFDQRLQEEAARVRRYGGSFSLVMLDIGDLDVVNDSLGFETGERILGWLGRLLREHTRASDVSFRCERDVFAILCPWTPPDASRVVGDRLVTLIGEAQPPVDVAVSLRPVSASATCPNDERDASPLYLHAQMALEAARGR